MLPSSDDFGFDHYTWRDGQRLRTRIVRSLRPGPDETNSQFEQAMSTMAGELAQMNGVIDVRFALEWRDGAIVECIIDVQHTPRPIAVVEDTRPAGSRPAGARGRRGGRVAA